MNSAMMSKTPPKSLKGRVRTPGDKSISHRALILGALAEGVTNITGLLEGDDILHTAKAVEAFGAKVKRIAPGHWQVEGLGRAGWRSPKAPVDFGNAGTGARLVMGAAAGFDLQVSYLGDASLSSRPMGRVLKPLEQMGAKFDSTDGKLPLSQTRGGGLTPIQYTPPHASAQVKSAILLAGLNTSGTTALTEIHLTRDHTENMLNSFGVKLVRKPKNKGQTVILEGLARLQATNINVPGDPSSAAFLIAAALVVPGSDILVENVMMNEARTGLFGVLSEMGAFIRADNFRRSGGETIADLHIRYNKLRGVNVPADRVPSMVDEYPVLAVIAATASGQTHMHGLGELRVKESDRLAGTHALLIANGVDASIEGETLIVSGGRIAGGAKVKTHHDHRLAMSALILGLAADKPVSIDDSSMIATSFPAFYDLLAQIGAPMDMA